MININAIQFYQFLKIINICKDKQFAIFSLYYFIIFKVSKKKKKILLNLKQIENLDIINLLLKISLNLFHISVSNLSNINTDIGDTVLLFYYLNK